MKQIKMCHVSTVFDEDIYLVGNKEFMEWVMKMLYEENSRETDMVQSHELTDAWMKIAECIYKEMSQVWDSNEQTETPTNDSLPF